MRADERLPTQFEGQITYGTECRTCHYKSERQEQFSELELSLPGFTCKLEDRIDRNLKDESLVDDNQSAAQHSPRAYQLLNALTRPRRYFCERCASKQDATRCTRLEVLPPVSGLASRLRMRPS